MRTERIGCVGLDGVAFLIAKRLLAAGAAVNVHDPRRSLAGLVAAGGRPALLPADAAQDADVVVLGAGGELADEFVFDHGGLSETLRTGGCLLDMSRAPALQSAAASSRLAGYGITRLELVAVGDAEQARAGELLLVLAGSAEDVAGVRGVLDLLGRSWHVGPIGTATEAAAALPAGPGMGLPMTGEPVAAGVDLALSA